ncbi:MAG: hypothetical protein NDJ90_12995, partial [Oligoflexia bacterium]|nr:hypothetical protein [Oligoflexia bacterium]
GGKSSLTLIAQPQDYFRELVSTALGRQKLSAQPETEFYLVNLLYQFMTTDHLYARDGQGAMKDEPLALMLKEALETPELQAQSALFRHVGDVSLYVAGYFQESLNRKLVDVDYYIGIGGSAYHQVANRTVEENALHAVYEELAAKFARFVEVLADVSDKTTPKTEQDLLRMYELWVRTRSPRAAKALQEAGILPNKTIGKDWQ